MPDPTPTADERKQLFRLIQQYSSLAAWEFVAGYHQVFVDAVKRAFEDTQKHPPPDGKPLLTNQDMAGFLNGYASMQGALARLRKGDKGVFKFEGFGVKGAPTFVEAYRLLNPRIEGILGAMFDARGMDFPPYLHPMFPEMEMALGELCEVWARNALCIEPRHTDVPAPLEWDFDYEQEGRDIVKRDHKTASCSSRGIACAGYTGFKSIPAAATLPDIPVRTEEVLIATGDPVPCYGIWEPVNAPMRKVLFGLFSRPQAPANGEFEIVGCMNYLHQGSEAPTVAFEEDAPRGEGRPTVWRLLWEDDRYRNGIVPPEEAGYRFEAPQFVPVPRPPSTIPPNPYIGFTHEEAEVAREWVCESNANWRIQLKVGDKFPIRDDGVMVGWIYQGDIPERIDAGRP